MGVVFGSVARPLYPKSEHPLFIDQFNRPDVPGIMDYHERPSDLKACEATLFYHNCHTTFGQEVRAHVAEALRDNPQHSLEALRQRPPAAPQERFVDALRKAGLTGLNSILKFR